LSLVRAVAQTSWRLRLQPTEGAWVDLGAAVPLLDSTRARKELGWEPAHRADDLFAEFLEAASHRRGIAGPLLRRRAV
jgi:nucleoside-diphosphate-sugar epimerase